MPENPDPRLEQHRAELRENKKRAQVISKSYRRRNPEFPLEGACERIEALDRAIRRAIKLAADGDTAQALRILAKAQAIGRYDEDRPLSSEAQSLWDGLQAQQRLCPTHSRWYDLWLSLPSKYPSLTGEQWHPPEPCTPDSREATPHSAKQDLLLQHIRWADQNHFLDKAGDFLRSLPEDAWIAVAPEGRPDLYTESKNSYREMVTPLALERGWSPEPSLRAEELVYFVHVNRYICPLPHHWDRLYGLLPMATGERPPPPLILGAWDARAAEKKRRLFEHILWADNCRSIWRIDKFIRALPHDEWYMREI